MAYSVFTEDEKDKMKDQLGSVDVTNQFVDIYGSNNGSKSLDDEIAIQNKALQDIINNQYTEENKIRDDYDSFGSRANRFLQVFGAGLKGENASQVAQAQRDDLNKRLQNAQTRYKDRRDSVSTQLKDLLNRKDALDKSKYERERDLVKDSQFEKEFGLKDRQIANQEKQTNFAIGQGKEKEKADLVQNELENKNKLKNKVQSDLDISTAFNSGVMKGTGGWFGGNNELKGSTIDKLSIKLVKDNLGIDPKDYSKFKKENPDVIPVPGDDEKVVKAKLINLGYNPVKSITPPDNSGKQVITYEDGTMVVYDSVNDDYTEVQ